MEPTSLDRVECNNRDDSARRDTTICLDFDTPRTAANDTQRVSLRPSKYSSKKSEMATAKSTIQNRRLDFGEPISLSNDR